MTADEGGHGAYLFGTNTCADDKVTAFLTSGARPARDTACAAEPARPAPAIPAALRLSRFAPGL